jgi:hypothetical protein
MAREPRRKQERKETLLRYIVDVKEKTCEIACVTNA